MTDATKLGKARAVGINHVALEVGDIDAALDFSITYLGMILLRGVSRYGHRRAYASEAPPVTPDALAGPTAARVGRAGLLEATGFAP